MNFNDLIDRLLRALLRHLVVDPVNSVNATEAIPIFEFANDFDDAVLRWRVTPVETTSDFQYHAGLFEDQRFPSGSARRMTLSEVIPLTQVTVNSQTGEFEYRVPEGKHHNPPNNNPKVFIFVVTRFETATSLHQVISSCTIKIRHH